MTNMAKGQGRARPNTTTLIQVSSGGLISASQLLDETLGKLSMLLSCSNGAEVEYTNIPKITFFVVLYEDFLITLLLGRHLFTFF